MGLRVPACSSGTGCHESCQAFPTNLGIPTIRAAAVRRPVDSSPGAMDSDDDCGGRYPVVSRNSITTECADVQVVGVSAL